MTDADLREVRISVVLAMRGGRLLMLERRDANPMWDHKWEFPGGKIEDGELPETAAKREFCEETGLDPMSLTFLGIHNHDWMMADGGILRVEIHCFRCEVRSSDVRIESRSAYSHAWATPEEALTYDCLAANADLIRLFLLNH